MFDPKVDASKVGSSRLAVQSPSLAQKDEQARPGTFCSALDSLTGLRDANELFAQHVLS